MRWRLPNFFANRSIPHGRTQTVDEIEFAVIRAADLPTDAGGRTATDSGSAQAAAIQIGEGGAAIAAATQLKARK